MGFNGAFGVRASLAFADYCLGDCWGPPSTPYLPGIPNPRRGHTSRILRILGRDGCGIGGLEWCLSRRIGGSGRSPDRMGRLSMADWERKSCIGCSNCSDTGKLLTS